tara:strand:+ start:20 stop:1051 length:1032 start_codon:yes stop_codon:yes gene_type:complete
MAYTTINKSTAHFNTKLYTGTGSNQAITGIGFQPDLVWWKCRNSAKNHGMTDAVRGNTKIIRSNLSDAENTDSYYVQSFDTDGFTAGTNGNMNSSGDTFVSWSWKAAGTSGSANNDGSIATTVAANTTAGFSIVKWTGTGSSGTLGHGLGAVPNTIWVKKTSATDDWFCWHTALGSQGKMNFNNTSAVQNDTGYWNNTTPTNQVFSVTSNGANNASGQTYIAYCFTNITGYSKFGSLTGNGSTNGTFVYCGFAPAFIIVKAKSSGNWFMYDNKRPGYNNVQQFLEADGTATEYTSNANHSIDILSNGFKFTGGSGSNTSGRECIFMAWGQSLVGSNNVPCTAK